MSKPEEPTSLDQTMGSFAAPRAQADSPDTEDAQALSKPSELGEALPSRPSAATRHEEAKTGVDAAHDSPLSSPQLIPSTSASSSLTEVAPDRPRETSKRSPSAFQGCPYASPSSQRSERSFTGRSPVRLSALEAPRTSTEYMLPQLPTVAAAAFRLPEADDLQDLLSTSSSEHTLEPFSSLDTLGGEHTSGTTGTTGTSSDPPFARDSPPTLESISSLGEWGSATVPAIASMLRLGTLAETSGTQGPSATSAAGTSEQFGKISEGPNPFAQRPTTAPARVAGNDEIAEVGTSCSGAQRPWRWNAGSSAEITVAAAAEASPAGPSSARSAPGEDSFVVPSAWGRTAQAGPEIVRSYAACAVLWCIVDGEGYVGMFPAAVQLLWWHGVHRIVDEVVKQANLCQADGGHQGFCIVAGVQAADAWRNARRGVKCASQLMAALGKVHLPNGEFASVRVGIHFGPAADGLVGTNRTLHYQMVGPTVETAKRIALHAAANQMLASRDLFRGLIIWEGEHFQFGGGPIIPLGHTRKVQAHAFVGPLPEISSEVHTIIDEMHARVASALPPGFIAPALAAAQGPLSGPQGDSLTHLTAHNPAASYGESMAAQGSHTGASRAESYQAEYEDVSALKADVKSAQDEAMRKLEEEVTINRASWYEEQFSELWTQGQRWLDVVANTCLVVSVICWLMGRPEDARGMFPASGDLLILALVLSFAAASCVPLFDWRLRPYVAGLIRTCRVLLLLYNEYSALAASSRGGLSWLERWASFVTPMMGISMLEGNLLPAHVLADAGIALVCLVMLPFLWHVSGFLRAFGFAIHVVAGLIVPTVLLSNLQQRAHFTFVHSLQRIYSGKAGPDEVPAYLGRDIKGKGKVA